MIKVICIDVICIDIRNIDFKGILTLYKIYECELDRWNNNKDDIFVKADDGAEWFFHKRRFIPLSEWREQQIDIILQS